LQNATFAWTEVFALHTMRSPYTHSSAPFFHTQM
jgi:hypothetical protein